MRFNLTISLTAACLFGAVSAPADSWMGRIDGNTYVAQLSIPGTHDACTGEGFETCYRVWGDLYARTQEKTIAQQWDCGIRAFDLRPTVVQDTGKKAYLRIYHGIMPTQVTLSDVFNTLQKKLQQEPTEFAIVVMRHENNADHNNPQWGALIKSLLTSDAYKGLFADYTPNLTVNDLRGKILVLSRDAYDTLPIGGFITSWSHEADFASQNSARINGPKETGSLAVQDYYDTSVEGAMQAKQNALITMLNYSATLNKNTDTNMKWVINHASGYSLVSTLMDSPISLSDGYRHNASVTNQAVINYLTDKSHTGPTGIVMMDYAGVDLSGEYDVLGLELTKVLIQNNFRFKMKETGDSGISEHAATH